MDNNSTPAELGGPVKTVVESYHGMDFTVPVYPNIVAEYQEFREGYLIQKLPEGFRFISIDLPEFQIDEFSQIEGQLPASDEFGPVVSTEKAAVQTARDHLHMLMADAADSYRPWSMRLAEDALSSKRKNIVADYTEEGFGYLIEQNAQSFRWIFVEPSGVDEPSPFYRTRKAALESALKDWKREGGGTERQKLVEELTAAIEEEGLVHFEAVSDYLTANASEELSPERIRELARGLAAELNGN